MLPILALPVLAVGGFEVFVRDHILPHVYVSAAGIGVGGDTQAAVAASLQPFSVRQRFRVVTLVPPHRKPVLVQAFRLGYTMDGGLTAWRAFTIGHSGSLLTRATAQIRTLIQGTDVAVAQHVDQRVLRAYLFKLAPGINQAPRPGVPGSQLDVLAAQQRIGWMLLKTGPVRIVLPVTAIPALPPSGAAQHRPAPRRPGR